MTITRGAITICMVVIAFLWPSSSLFAQDSIQEITDRKLTLTEALQVALANNPEVNRAILSTNDAEELVKIAYSEIFPDITSSIAYTRNIEIPVQFIPARFFDETAPEGALAPVQFGTDNNWQGGFTVNQTLFRGETIIGLSSATVFKMVQEENLRLVSQQVVTQTRLAYYQVLAAIEQLRLQKAQINRLEQNLNENEKRAAAGIVDDYSVLQLQVQLSNQKPLLIEAEYAVLEAYRNLKFTLGLPYQLDFEVVGSLNEFDIVTPQAGTEANESLKMVDRLNPFSYQSEPVMAQELASRRGDLRVLGASLELNQKEVTATKSRFLPTLSATYNLQWNAAEPEAPDFFENSNRFQTLGINFSLPLFQGFKRVADVNRVVIQRKDLEEQVRATTLTAQNEVASAAEDINMAFETATARKIALQQAQEGYRRAQLRFDNGLGSQIEVTEAEVQVRQAEVNYAVMVFSYLSAKAQYDLATGLVPLVDTQLTN